MTRPQTFRKARHLCLRKDIEALFEKGNLNAVAFPLRVVWLWKESGEGVPYQVMVSVSKRKVRHAVDRNRAKRQMREAFRLNQESLQAREDHTLRLAFIWLAASPQPSEKVAHAVQHLIHCVNNTETAALPIG